MDLNSLMVVGFGTRRELQPPKYLNNKYIYERRVESGSYITRAFVKELRYIYKGKSIFLCIYCSY